MKRLLAFLILIGSAFATTTVTGNVQTLGTGNVTGGAFVRFWLRGCGGNIPRVNGTAVIGTASGGTYYFDFPVASNGSVSGTLYSTRDASGTGNGDIECGGSKTSVWYGMQVYVSGKGGPEVPIHANNGVTLNISSVTPITTNPVVTAPTGDTTYLRLDAGNSPVTGGVTFQGADTFSGTNTFSGTTNLNGTNNFAGGTFSAGFTANGNNSYSGTNHHNGTFNQLSFTNPWIGVDLTDSSPNSTNGQAQGESYALPVMQVTVHTTGTGVPIPGYFYVSASSPGANNTLDASNLIGVFGGAESNGTNGDNHSGVWGGNFLAACDATGSTECSIFGLETNIFTNRLDPGRYSASPSHRPAYGVVSTSSGTNHIQLGYQVTSSNGTTNDAYVGYSCDKVVDSCFDAGTPLSGSNPATFGFRTHATGVATGGGNTQSLPIAYFASTWNGSAAQSDVFQWENEPLTGTNPASFLTLRHCANGNVFTGCPSTPTNIFSISSAGVANAVAIISNTGNNSSTGFVRLANTDKICSRDSANGSDHCFGEIQTASQGTTCATGASAGAVCTVSVSWASAFANTNYKVTCQGNGVTTGVPVIGALTAKAAGSVTVQTVAITAVAAQFNSIECSAIHD